MASDHRFLKACRREAVDRVPIWLMRQAGRYQASYRAVRSKVSFLELCRTPELVAQVTVAPIDEFGLDAAILFSDILIALPAIGFGGGPFTVASYAVEGGSHGFTRLKILLYTDPPAAHALMEKLTRAAIVQLQAQAAAGAQALQVFESWLGELGREDLEEVSLPYLARIAEAIRGAGLP